jgi:hypothetical protein
MRGRPELWISLLFASLKAILPSEKRRQRLPDVEKRFSALFTILQPLEGGNKKACRGPGRFGENSVENRSEQLQAATDDKSRSPWRSAGFSRRQIF